MNSSMLAGERRWASSRRGGMTVLGKVAVPKPLNLPSQRLENHGLDPNVEIVPKGTLSWGSRPSSSGSNPWVSSSPNTEGGTVSPSHLSGRPSSGGTGTRPSTAGSERTHEHVANSWVSNSRPSSASGTLSSNQTSSTSLRPRSAENRPNSSQLSRFADPVSKSSAAWGASGTAERLGVKSSKEDGFSLNTGDFPTVGTEKDNSTKNTELEDHGRPSSASGIISHGKEDARSQADVKHGTVNTWRADDPQSEDNDYHPSMEKWHADNPQYFNSYTAPQHFDTWRGPPMNGPANVWYGGGPRGPPYGAPLRPGGFPLEPFPYYRPQIAPPPLAGSQPVPPQGPRGHHPKNGDLYRPQLPDHYARPGMPPFRPGFYPAPSGPGPMAFESFYGPPMGYERDIPYMGMAAGPPVYNGSYPGPAPDLGNSHGRNVRGHHGGKTSSEQVESEDNTQGTKRVTLKTSNQCDQREEGETQEHNVQQFDISYPEKNRLPIISSRKSEWGAEEDTDEAMYDKMAPSEMQPRNIEHRVHSADGVRVKSFEGMSNAKAVHDNWSNAPKSGPSFPPEMSRVHLGSERESSVPTGTRNPTLMQKIDGLNAKTRVSDGWNDSPSAYNREEERNRSHVSDMKVNYNTGKVSNTAGPLERTPASRDFVSVPHEVSVPVTDKPTQPMIASRRHHHGGQQGRVDYRGKVKFNGQDADGWQKKSLTAEASSTITASHNESLHSSQAHGPDNVEASESSVTSNPVGKVEGDSVETHDSIDIQAQRAKLRESVKQRALQLQKEEEERTREQRAKALAKLEELNRRTLAGEAVSDKADKGEVINAIQGERHESRTVDEPVMADHSNANQAGESVEIPKNIPLESNISTLPEHEDAHDNSVKKPAPQYNNSKHKRTSYKQKQSNPLQKSFTEKPVSNVADEPQKDHILGEAKLSESTVPNTSDTVVEPPASQRRKNNRSGKNKQHKLDETPLPPPVESTNVNPGKDSIENVVAKNTLSDWDSAFSVEPDKSMPAQEVLSSSPNEESHSRVSNQWKPHPSRRLPRNQQVNNKVHGGDNTAVWAPVRTQNRAKGPVEAGPNPVQESTNSTNGNNNNNMGQSSLKGKRAEMERYIPKPVAKELAQQVNVLNSSSSVTSSRSNDWSIGEVNEGDIFRNKHRKDQGAWKQRGPPTDSSHVKGAHSTSEPTKEIQQSKEIIGQSVKSEIDSLNTGDGYNLPNNNMNKAKYPLVKDQGVTGRGKRNGPKGPAASTGNNNNPDHENTFSSEVDMNQMDRTKENQASSHWQPKPSSNTANNQQHGNRYGSLTTETKSIPKKEHPQHRVVEGGNFTQPGQSVNVKSNVAQESTAGHRQEFEKRAKGRPYSPNQEPVPPGELPHAATEDVRFERIAPFGSRRNSRQSNRSGRGHEPHGEWVPGHDNRPHNNAPPFGDNRRAQNLHYEYQPVGPFKGNRPERVEEPADGTDGMDKSHRERGRGQPRRGGNFNRRQSGPSSNVGSSGWE